jgi:hypothetical protein
VTDRYDAAPPVQEITIERAGDWILVRLDGEVVWKRLTRDPAFTRARVAFMSNRSPAVPKSRLAFNTVLLGGDWRPGGYWHFNHNSVDLPIPAAGEPLTRWTLHGGHD